MYTKTKNKKKKKKVLRGKKKGKDYKKI